MKTRQGQVGISVLLFAIVFCSFGIANPVLSPGAWTNIGTPETFGIAGGQTVSGSYGTGCFGVSKSNPSIIYLPVDMKGLWKTTDGGSTWHVVGTNPGSAPWTDLNNATVSYLDSPIWAEVDPADPSHLYCTQGVRGYALGFWVSHNGGLGWKRTPTSQEDLTSMSIDPSDFNHVLVATHSTDCPGVYESRDGGKTFSLHPNNYGWAGGTQTIIFLYHPASGTGSANTWLEGNYNGFWRTTDGGANWTKVSSNGSNHGGGRGYYTSGGVFYLASSALPMRSTDNGVTWTTLGTGMMTAASYYDIKGDGTRLYTGVSQGWAAGPWNIMTSLENDGSTWTAYNAQTFPDGPLMMVFDAVNRIMYSSNWGQGFWALKVDGTTGAVNESADHQSLKPLSAGTAARIFAGTGLEFKNTKGEAGAVDVYNVKGALLYRRQVGHAGSMSVDAGRIGRQAVVMKTR